MLAQSDPLYASGSGRETSAASAGQVVLYTGNFFAAYSLDYGRQNTWSYLSPFGLDNGQVTFCCDQVVRYIPQIDRFVWLMQYNEEPNGEDRERLLVASPEQVARDGAQTQWAQFDITSASVGMPGQWLDFPELVVGHKFLYLTTNVYKTRRDKLGAPMLDKSGNQIDDPTGGVLVRMPLSELQHTNGAWRANILPLPSGAGVRPAQFDPRQTPAPWDNTAYLVSNKTRSTFTVTSIDENSSTAYSYDLDHITISDTPDNNIPWLSRAQRSGSLDTRIIGATRSGYQLWTASNEGTSSSNGLTRPGIHVAVINVKTKEVDAETILHDDQYAFAFPKLVTNDHGLVGVVSAYGDQNTGLAASVMRSAGHYVESAAGLPLDVGIPAPWGGADYMDIELAHPHTDLFAIAGYTAVQDTTVGGANIAYNPSYNVFGLIDQVPDSPPPPTFLENSSIALTCPSGPLTPAQVASVTGQLTPALGNQSIAVSVTGPLGSRRFFVLTSTGGAFSFSTPPTQPGPWQVTARWGGDTNHLDSSASCSYAVSPTPPPGKSPSSISLDCPSQVNQFSTIDVSGTLNPADAGMRVGFSITIRADNGQTYSDSDLVASDIDGSYRYSYAADVTGYYDFQAQWDGDATHGSSVSPICTVHVIEIPK